MHGGKHIYLEHKSFYSIWLISGPCSWAAERSDYTMVWEGRALFTHNACPPNSIVNLNVPPPMALLHKELWLIMELHDTRLVIRLWLISIVLATLYQMGPSGHLQLGNIMQAWCMYAGKHAHEWQACIMLVQSLEYWFLVGHPRISWII